MSDQAIDDVSVLDVEILPPGEGYDFKEETETKPPKEAKPKAGPPRLDEWQDFFSRVLIKGITDRYVDFLFRDVDENLLTERELKRIYLSSDEREHIARPFTELSNKSKFMRKHGRMIIASSDAVEAVLALSIWFGRVNRIAAKYRPIEGQVIEGGEPYVSTGPASPNGNRRQTGQENIQFGAFIEDRGDFPHTG